MFSRKAMAVATVLLVILNLALCSYTLFTFYTREKSIKEDFYTTRFLETIYSREEKINFYLREVFDEAHGADESEYIYGFKQELGKYKIDGKYVMSEFSQIEKQADNLIIENGKLIGNFSIMIQGEAVVDDKKVFSATHTFQETLEKEV